jgi:hypothetical protein
MELIYTNNAYQPLECIGQSPDCPALSKMQGASECVLKPRCPRGTRPLAGIPGQQPFHCVVDTGAQEPELTSGAGAAAAQAPKPARTSRSPADQAFLRYSVSGQIAFEFPKSWNLTDAWKNEPPTISVSPDTGEVGKQATLTVTLNEPGQPAYQSLDVVIAREREEQEGGAWEDVKGGLLSGHPVRTITIRGSSRSAYVDCGAGRYFTLSYSAPSDLYEMDLPFFERLLKSFRILAADKK